MAARAAGGAVVATYVHVQPVSVEPTVISTVPSLRTSSCYNVEVKAASTGSNMCNTCRKRVSLTGFSCKCGNLFCATHRYSEKHDCTYDHRTACQDAITKANLVVKAEKLDKV